MSNNPDTLSSLSKMAHVARQMQAERLKHAQSFFINANKELRTFTQKEAASLLGVNSRTLSRRFNGDDFKNLQFERAANGHYKFTLQNIFDMANIMNIDHGQRHESDKLQVVAMAALKGGCGKTTNTVNIATSLALTNIKRLRIGIIDLDPQGSCTPFFVGNSSEEISVGDLLLERVEMEEGESWKDVVSQSFVKTHIPNIRVLPSRIDDFYFEHYTAQEIQNSPGNDYDSTRHYHKLKEKVIDHIQDEFDVIFIDTAPTLNYMYYNGLLAATSVLIPVHPEPIDMSSNNTFLERLVEIYETIAAVGHPGYDFLNLIISNYSRQNATQRAEVSRLKQFFGPRIFDTNVYHSLAFSACAETFETIFDMKSSEYVGSPKVVNDARNNLIDVAEELRLELCKHWPTYASELEQGVMSHG